MVKNINYYYKLINLIGIFLSYVHNLYASLMIRKKTSFVDVWGLIKFHKDNELIENYFDYTI